MGHILIGMSFFRNNSVTLDLASNIVKFPDITLRSVNMIFKYKLLELKTTMTTVIQPNQQVFVPVVIKRDLGDITGTVKGLPAFERRSRSQRNSGGSDLRPSHKPTGLPSHRECGYANSVVPNHDTQTSQQFAADDQSSTQFDLTTPRGSHGSLESSFPGSNCKNRLTMVPHLSDMQ